MPPSASHTGVARALVDRSQSERRQPLRPRQNSHFSGAGIQRQVNICQSTSTLHASYIRESGLSVVNTRIAHEPQLGKTGGQTDS